MSDPVDLLTPQAIEEKPLERPDLEHPKSISYGYPRKDIIEKAQLPYEAPESHLVEIPPPQPQETKNNDTKCVKSKKKSSMWDLLSDILYGTTNFADKKTKETKKLKSNIYTQKTIQGWAERSYPQIDLPEVNDIEALVLLICHLQRKEVNDQGVYVKDSIQLDSESKKRTYEKRDKKLKQLIEKNKTIKTWGHVNSIVSLIGFALAGAATIFSGGYAAFTIAPIIAWAISGALMVDKFTGDKVKKLLAAVMVKIATGEEDEEIKEKAKNILDIASGIVGGVLGIFSGGSGTANAIIKATSTAAQSTTNIAGSVMHMQRNTTQSKVTKYDHRIYEKQENFKELKNYYESLINSMHDVYNNDAEIRKKMDETMKSIIKTA